MVTIVWVLSSVFVGPTLLCPPSSLPLGSVPLTHPHSSLWMKLQVVFPSFFNSELPEPLPLSLMGLALDSARSMLEPFGLGGSFRTSHRSHLCNPQHQNLVWKPSVISYENWYSSYVKYAGEECMEKLVLRHFNLENNRNQLKSWRIHKADNKVFFVWLLFVYAKLYFLSTDQAEL